MYNTILVTVETTPTDRVIIEHVKQLAQLLKSSVVLLHVATDLVAGIVAVTTIVVVRRLTRLLSPGKLAGTRRMMVVRVSGGPNLSS